VATALPSGEVWNCGGRSDTITSYNDCYSYDAEKNIWNFVRYLNILKYLKLKTVFVKNKRKKRL